MTLMTWRFLDDEMSQLCQDWGCKRMNARGKGVPSSEVLGVELIELN